MPSRRCSVLEKLMLALWWSIRKNDM